MKLVVLDEAAGQFFFFLFCVVGVYGALVPVTSRFLLGSVPVTTRILSNDDGWVESCFLTTIDSRREKVLCSFA